MAQRHPCEGFVVSPKGQLPTPCAHYTALLVLVYVTCTIWLLQPPPPIPSPPVTTTPAHLPLIEDDSTILECRTVKRERLILATFTTHIAAKA